MLDCSTCASEDASCLSRVPIFKNLEQEQMKRVRSLIQQRTLESGEVLFREGDVSESLILMRFGTLKLVRYNSSGQELLLETLYGGDFYGGDQLFSESHCRQTGIALEEAGICTIASKDLRDLMLSNPSLGLKVMVYLNTKLEDYRFHVEILATKNVERRLAMYLLERIRQSGGHEVLLSQEEIGNAINLTKETVNRKLAHLQDLQVLAVSGKRRIILRDIPFLSNLASE